jgi:hypothetical protein
MLARLNAIKGDKNDAKSSLGHMHSAHAVYLSTMLLAAGVDMMREREREREREVPRWASRTARVRIPCEMFFFSSDQAHAKKRKRFFLPLQLCSLSVQAHRFGAIIHAPTTDVHVEGASAQDLCIATSFF